MNRLKFIVPAVLLLGLTACQSTPAPSPVTNPGSERGPPPSTRRRPA